MVDMLAMMLGGRVAEETAIGDITTGASNDIERATKMAKQMVTRFGMSEKLGPQTFGEANHEVFLGRDFSANADYSPEVAYEIDKEISRLIDEAYERARGILTERRTQLNLMAGVLIERETVDKEELEALLNDKWAEFLEKEAADKKDSDKDSDSAAEPAKKESATEPERGGLSAEPPMAPGTPPVLGS
jgi:cell division protease FtsH